MNRLLRILIALNAVDAGTTLVITKIYGTQMELNPAMRFLLEISPALFLVFKLTLVEVMGTWLATLKKPDDRAGKIALQVLVFAYTGLILFQVYNLL